MKNLLIAEISWPAPEHGPPVRPSCDCRECRGARAAEIWRRAVELLEGREKE